MAQLDVAGESTDKARTVTPTPHHGGGVVEPVGSAEGGVVVNAEVLPLLLTVGEVAGLLRIGRNGAYAAVATGAIPSVRIGRTIRVPRDALLEQLAEEAAGASREHGSGA